MGSKEGPEDERPAHEVTLAAYDIDRFPVTNAQFAEFLNARVGNTCRLRAALRLRRSGCARASPRRALERSTWISRTTPSSKCRGAARSRTAHGAANACRPKPNGKRPHAAPTARRYPWGNDIPDHRRARYESAANETAPVDASPQARAPRASGICQATHGNGCRALIARILIAPTMAVKIRSRGPCVDPRRRARLAGKRNHHDTARSHALAQSRVGASQHRLSLCPLTRDKT